jgi:hypothetical protein
MLCPAHMLGKKSSIQQSACNDWQMARSRQALLPGVAVLRPYNTTARRAISSWIGRYRDCKSGDRAPGAGFESVRLARYRRCDAGKFRE